MSLGEEITRKYQSRSHKDHLYSGTYARLALEERAGRMKQIFTQHRREGDTILEIGAGHGDNVPLLMAGGFSANGIFLNELLPERVSNIRSRYPSVRLYEGDALKIGFEKKFNWIFQSTVFTSVTDDSLRRQLARRMWELLEPGGHILWYDFIYNNPRNPDVRGVGIKEARALFPAAAGAEIHRVTLAPPIGRLVGRWYRLFNVPFLRSHILAVFHKPR